jgi:pimeloyl-ACP methyl ester carboxylesterase
MKIGCTGPSRDAGLLNVGYAEAGPADGPEAILLHGWPYDIYSSVDVAPLLASGARRSWSCPPRLPTGPVYRTR